MTADRDYQPVTIPAPVTDTLAPATNGWNGFSAPITDSTSHNLNVVIAGGYVTVHYKLSGPVVQGNPLAAIPMFGLLDCESVASWATHDVPWRADWNENGDGYEYVPATHDYAIGLLTFDDEVGECATLTVTLLDGSVHTAAFKLVCDPAKPDCKP